MKISVKVVGLWKLVEKMGNKGCGVVEFPGGTANDLFRHLLAHHGFVWADFPLLEKWEENINLSIVHNDDILLKVDYDRRSLADGDKLSLYVQTGCC
jgi:hypothetical protein